MSTFGCAAVQGTVRVTEMNKKQMYSRRRGLGFECLSSREERHGLTEELNATGPTLSGGSNSNPSMRVGVTSLDLRYAQQCRLLVTRFSCWFTHPLHVTK